MFIGTRPLLEMMNGAGGLVTLGDEVGLLGNIVPGVGGVLLNARAALGLKFAEKWVEEKRGTLIVFDCCNSGLATGFAADVEVHVASVADVEMKLAEFFVYQPKAGRKLVLVLGLSFDQTQQLVGRMKPVLMDYEAFVLGDEMLSNEEAEKRAIAMSEKLSLKIKPLGEPT